MRQLLGIAIISFFSCAQTLPNKKSEAGKPEKMQTEPAIGIKIKGDFDGNGQKESATVYKIKEAVGNPAEGGTPAEYEIQFSGNRIKSIHAGCCDIRLINEGDLNNDGSEEISIFRAPLNGCTYAMTTYAFIKGNWQQLVATFLIPTGCDELSDEDLHKSVFKEDNGIYYYTIDPDDENGKLIKIKASDN